MTTNELWEEIEIWFDGLEDTVSHRSYQEHSLLGAWAIQHDVRKHLAWIDHALLQIEVKKESESSGDLCNELGRENATLRNDLTDMTLNYNAAEKHARQLEEEVVRKNDIIVDLKKRSGTLEAVRTANHRLIKKLKEQLYELQAAVGLRNERLEVERLKKERDVALTSNAWLRKQLATAKKYASALKADLDNKSQLYLDEARHARELEAGNRRLKTALEHKNDDLGAAFRNNDTLRSMLAHKHRQLAQAYSQVKGLQRTLEEMGLS